MEESGKISTCHSAASPGLLKMFKNLLMMVRVAHWAKNLFLFIPLFFAGSFFDPDKLLQISLGVAAFCLTASGIYILNDLKDLEQDRQHPVKKHRAIASGEIPKGPATAIMVFCLMGGMAIGLACGIKFLLVLGLYFLLNLGYSLGLKNVAILDIMILASGFVLRVKAGGVLAEVGTSQWLMIMVFLLSLFLALAKRRDDALVVMSSGKQIRHSISGYNMDFLNTSLVIVSAIMIMAYIMYTLSPEVIRHLGTYRLYYTGIFVLAGLMRYLQLIYTNRDTGSPIRILYRDRFIQICIILWLLSFYFFLYFKDYGFFLAQTEKNFL